MFSIKAFIYKRQKINFREMTELVNYLTNIDFTVEIEVYSSDQTTQQSFSISESAEWLQTYDVLDRLGFDANHVQVNLSFKSSDEKLSMYDGVFYLEEVSNYFCYTLWFSEELPPQKDLANKYSFFALDLIRNFINIVCPYFVIADEAEPGFMIRDFEPFLYTDYLAMAWYSYFSSELVEVLGREKFDAEKIPAIKRADRNAFEVLFPIDDLLNPVDNQMKVRLSLGFPKPHTWLIKYEKWFGKPYKDQSPYE